MQDATGFEFSKNDSRDGGGSMGQEGREDYKNKRWVVSYLARKNGGLSLGARERTVGCLLARAKECWVVS